MDDKSEQHREPVAPGDRLDSAPVNRLWLWKERYGGGGQNVKDLVISYTTDGGPLSSRTWIPVTGLANGYHGTEFLVATAVNVGGTVVGDIHDSTSGDGWASLTFNTVTATPCASRSRTRIRRTRTATGSPPTSSATTTGSVSSRSTPSR